MASAAIVAAANKFATDPTLVASRVAAGARSVSKMVSRGWGCGDAGLVVTFVLGLRRRSDGCSGVDVELWSFSRSAAPAPVCRYGVGGVRCLFYEACGGWVAALSFFLDSVVGRWQGRAPSGIGKVPGRCATTVLVPALAAYFMRLTKQFLQGCPLGVGGCGCRRAVLLPAGSGGGFSSSATGGGRQVHEGLFCYLFFCRGLDAKWLRHACLHVFLEVYRRVFVLYFVPF